MVVLPIDDRADAGRMLAGRLTRYAGRDDVVVLALPRGGVPVAAEIARALSASLDLLPVRRLPAPGHKSVTMGAIASGGVRVWNRGVIAALGIGADMLEAVAEMEANELERRETTYRGNRPLPDIHEHCVILVDDGATTGANLQAAVAAARAEQPSRIVCAVPVASESAIAALASEADEVVCLATPEPVDGAGRWYRSSARLSDNNVCDILAEFWADEGGQPLYVAPAAMRRLP